MKREAYTNAGKPLSEFWDRSKRKIIQPVNSYTGYAAALQSKSGVPFVVCAPTEEGLQTVMREIKPMSLSNDLCHTVSIFSEAKTEVVESEGGKT